MKTDENNLIVDIFEIGSVFFYHVKMVKNTYKKRESKMSVKKDTGKNNLLRKNQFVRKKIKNGMLKDVKMRLRRKQQIA